MAMEDIEKLTKAFADARALLAGRVASFQEEKQKLVNRKLPGIRKAVAAAQDAQDALKVALEENKTEFERPKSRVLHGIKVGFAKAKGKVSFTNELSVIKLIRKHFPEKFDVLVKTTEKPVKKALSNLSTNDLKKIGCTATETGDAVLIQPQDGEVDKLVDALLKDEKEVEGEE